MAYSTIRPKKKLLSCGCFDFNFSKNRCKQCATFEDSKKRIEKQIAIEKEQEKSHKSNPNPIREPKIRKGTFIHPEVSENEVKALIRDDQWDMEAFWRKAAAVIAKTERCWNCGEWIDPKYYRAATAHIFPKSIFVSVASNEWNFIVAAAGCGCHSDTHTLEKFSKMPVFGTAVNRFRKFEHLITETHKYLSLFREYAEAHEQKNGLK